MGKSKATNKRRGSAPFRPRARLLVLLGEQLITNEVVAVTELVKNAFDADATSVVVTLEDVANQKRGCISVRDDGVGMSLDTILNVWLEPATSFRQKQRDERERTAVYRRVPLGEKGIGRFAAHKLGDVVRLVTREKGSPDEVTLSVNWKAFYEADKYLDKVPVRWALRKPAVFDSEGAHGTLVEVVTLRRKWTTDMVRELSLKLKGLLSPFDRSSNFKVAVQAPEMERSLAVAPKLADALEQAPYKLEGTVSKTGSLNYSYQFNNPAFPQHGRRVEGAKLDVRDARHFQGGRKPKCGRFKIRFYVWDRDPPTLRETVDEQYFKNVIDPQTGIRIYRDSFRIWPYGERGDDWLGLDLRRVQMPQVRLSRNQIIGVVEISSRSNPQLRDKTDREGLIHNDEFGDFEALVIGSIAVLQQERRPDRERINRLRQRAKPRDEVQQRIEDLRDKMQTRGHLDHYKGNLSRLQTAYRKRMREVVEPLIVAAGLGLSYTLPVHEVLRNLKSARSALRSLRAEAGVRDPEQLVKELNDAIAAVRIAEDSVRGVGRISRRGRMEPLDLRAAALVALDIMKNRLVDEDVESEFSAPDEIRVIGQQNLIVTALLNLIDNAAYWLLHRAAGRRILVRLEDGRREAKVIISDNGPGIRDDPSLLVEPFFSRKPDGSGLGLYIVDRVMRAHRGKVEFLDARSRPDLLEGATVALVFPKEG